jgi:hypothetical protein
VLEDFTAATFAPHVGETFRVHVDDASSVDIELVRIREPEQTAPGRAPFTLLFRGPREPVLPQRIYRFERDGFEPFEIFIVPMGPNQSGMQYEAVFA